MIDRDFLTTYPAVTEFFEVPSAPDRARAIIRDVAFHRDVPITHLFSTMRERRVAWARHEIWFRLRQECAWSYPKIGKHFGKDHTTILYGIRAHRDRMAWMEGRKT